MRGVGKELWKCEVKEYTIRTLSIYVLNKFNQCERASTRAQLAAWETGSFWQLESPIETLTEVRTRTGLYV